MSERLNEQQVQHYFPDFTESRPTGEITEADSRLLKILERRGTIRLGRGRVVFISPV